MVYLLCNPSYANSKDTSGAGELMELWYFRTEGVPGTSTCYFVNIRRYLTLSTGTRYQVTPGMALFLRYYTVSTRVSGAGNHSVPIC